MNRSRSDLPGDDGWPIARLAWGTVAILAIAQFVNALDRYLINLLVESIKTDLQVTDTQIGLLLGFAFALFYTLMGLPIGRWADTFSRRIIIICGVLFWSIATMSCGLAQSFKQLFLARMAVGAGEASLNPCGYSLISDYFPAHRRARPMGIFIAGSTIGSAAVLFLGGLLLEYMTDRNMVLTLPWGDQLKPWQICFVLAGLPGLAVAVLVRLIREPPRREMIQVTGNGDDSHRVATQLSLREVVIYARTHVGCFVPVFLGFAFVLMWAMGKDLWAPTFMLRHFGWSPSQVGLAMAVIMICGNTTGVIAGGWASEWISRRGYRDAHLRTAFLGALLGLPFAIAGPLIPNATASIIVYFPAFFFGAFPFALGPAAIASITPNQMRAQITALYLLTINLLGYGLGPTLIGTFTDHVFGDTRLIGQSMALAAVVALPAALVFLWIGMRAYLRTIDELAAHSTG